LRGVALAAICGDGSRLARSLLFTKDSLQGAVGFRAG